MFSLTYHEETSATASGRDMGYALVGISTVSVGNAVGDDLHREMTGNRGAVVSVETDI